MQKFQTKRRVRPLGAAVVALISLLGLSFPVASAVAQSRNTVNSWDVDPNYHMNFMSNPCSLGYWNQNLTCAPYGYGVPPYGYYGYYGNPYFAHGYPW